MHCSQGAPLLSLTFEVEVYVVYSGIRHPGAIEQAAALLPIAL